MRRVQRERLAVEDLRPEFARLGAKEKEDIEMIERDDVRRDKGSALTPIEVNRLFRAIGAFIFIIVCAI